MEEAFATKAELSPEQLIAHREDEENRMWLKNNLTYLKTVTLTFSHNDRGTPIVQASGPGINTNTICQPPTVYIKALRRALADSEWAKNPRDDLGDLPTCDQPIGA